MEKFIKVIVKYPSNIKIGNNIVFEPNTICEVIGIEKGKRHSRENGYPYHFTGKQNDTIYKNTYYRDVVKYIYNNKSIIVNFRCKDYKNNIKNNFVHIDTFERKTIMYNDEKYHFIDLQNYNEIIIECDTYEDEYILVEGVKNGYTKYIMFMNESENICVRCDNFQKINIINHYYGASNMNSPLFNETEIDDAYFNDIYDNELNIIS